MRVYMKRRGRFGVSFGIFGAIAIGFGYLLAFLFVAALVVLAILPFVAAFLFAAICTGVDRILWIVPKYKRRRNRLGKVQWYLKPLEAIVSITFERKRRRSQRDDEPIRTVEDQDRAAIQVPEVAEERASEAEIEALRQTKRQILTNMFMRLSPIEFTQIVGELLYTMNYEHVQQIVGATVLTAVSRRTQETVVAECESFSPGSSVGVKNLRDAIPLIQSNGARQLLFVSFNPFTPQAIKLAADSGIHLVDRDRLLIQASLVGLDTKVNNLIG